MNRLIPCLLASICLPLACGLSGEGEGIDPSRESKRSELARCLLDGGHFEVHWSRPLDAAGISALAVSPDGTVAVGEGLGAIGVLRSALDDDHGPPEALHEILLPAAGQPVTALSFSVDGEVLASGDAAGQVASIPVRSNGAWLWERVSEDAINSIGSRAQGEAVAWVEDAFSGHPRLWAWPEVEEVPAPVQTILWSASETLFSADEALWLLAGEWYGVPAVEVRLADAASVIVATWLMEMETLVQRGGSGWITGVDVSADDAFLVAAGRFPLSGVSESEGGGFLTVVNLDEVSRTAPAPDVPAAELTGGEVVFLGDHLPVAVHLLGGDEVMLTRGAGGDVVAWALDGFERLASLEAAAVGATEVGATAVDADGSVLLLGDADGVLTGVGCRVE